MTSKKRQFCGNCAGEIEVEEGKVIGRMTWPSSSERALIEVSECGFQRSVDCSFASLVES